MIAPAFVPVFVALGRARAAVADLEACTEPVKAQRTAAKHLVHCLELRLAHAVAEKLGGGWLARCPAIPAVVQRHQFQHEALTRAQGEALRLLRSEP